MPLKFPRTLEAGDLVIRRIGLAPLCSDMTMIVVWVTDDHIFCDEANTRPMLGLPISEHWKFDRTIGCEENPGLEWGRKFGITGSRLMPLGASDDDSRNGAARNQPLAG